MTRLSKQARRRNVSPKRPSTPGPKTGPKKDNLDLGYKEKVNGLAGELGSQIFISKVKSL